MLGQKLFKWLIALIIIGIVGYALFLSLDDQWRFVYQPQPVVEPNNAQIDSTIPVVKLEREVIPVDTVALPSHRSAAVEVVDSDSVVHYDLYRHQQAIVTIDLEEHKEKVFFTWDDLKAYFRIVIEHVDSIKNKL